MNEIIARMEKDLIKNRLEYLSTLPSDIFNQLKRIEASVFDIWKLDSVFTGSVMLDSFNACLNSNLTLDQLEELIKEQGQKLNNKPFNKVLKNIVKKSKRSKTKSGLDLIHSLIEKAARDTSKV